MTATASFTVDISGLRALASRYPQAYKREVVSVLDLVVRRLEGAVVAKTPKGVGGAAGLAGSIFGEVRNFGNTITGVVGTPLAYGIVVELGRRPGKRMPPLAPIELWARRMLGLDEEEAKKAAWAIARKISIKGFKGVGMFSKSLDELTPWIQQMLATIPARIVARVDNEQG
jgi:hypothetical protein